jgi:S-adenosylmethionine/arginine decarboxylase-like enzyme
MTWGIHAIANLLRCPKHIITSKPRIHDFTVDLVKRIDMKAYGHPQIIHFGEGNKAGYTLVQLIETSNVTGHFCDESGDAYIDIFSCKDFDKNVVRDVLLEHFHPHALDIKLIKRQAGTPMLQ